MQLVLRGSQRCNWEIETPILAFLSSYFNVVREKNQTLPGCGACACWEREVVECAGAAPRLGFGGQCWDAPDPGPVLPVLLRAMLRKITSEPVFGETVFSLLISRWLLLPDQAGREE